MRQAVAILVATFTLFACGARREGLDPGQVPEGLRADYDLFTRRCSKCHSLARPLNSGFSEDEQWTLYVNRMRRQPGSGISLDDQTHILKFLYWYASELRAKRAGKEAPTAAAPSGEPPSPPPSAAPASPPPSAAPAPSPPSVAPAPAVPDGGAP
jgi:hypothetical protein